MATIQVLDREYAFFDGVEYCVFGRTLFGRGSYVSKMSELISAGFIPMSIADILEKRVEAVRSDDSEKRDFWLGNRFDSGDGLSYHEDKFRVVYDSGHLRKVNSQSKLRVGCFELSVNDFNSLDGVAFSRSKLESYGIERDLSRDEAKQHPVWKALARNDDALLNDSVNVIFDEMKKLYGHEGKGMGIYLPFDSDVPLLRAWGIGLFTSDVSGCGCLDDEAVLVGMRAKGTKNDLAKSP